MFQQCHCPSKERAANSTETPVVSRLSIKVMKAYTNILNTKSLNEITANQNNKSQPETQSYSHSLDATCLCCAQDTSQPCTCLCLQRATDTDLRAPLRCSRLCANLPGTLALRLTQLTGALRNRACGCACLCTTLACSLPCCMLPKQACRACLCMKQLPSQLPPQLL